VGAPGPPIVIHCTPSCLTKLRPASVRPKGGMDNRIVAVPVFAGDACASRERTWDAAARMLRNVLLLIMRIAYVRIGTRGENPECTNSALYHRGHRTSGRHVRIHAFYDWQRGELLVQWQKDAECFRLGLLWPNVPRPRQQRWRLDLLRQIGANMVVTAGYAGSFSDQIRVTRRLDSLPGEYWNTSMERKWTH
jgi:hypothetical protein